MVSIVLAGRNDDYGMGFLERFQNCINVLVPLMRLHAPDSEIAIVEWNPPPDRPRLAEALAWPREARELNIRIIEVPPELHQAVAASSRCRFIDPVARNVGVRRATGDMVLITNPDIIFAPSLVSLFGEQVFSPEWFYRIDRYDTRLPPMAGRDYESLLEAGRAGIFQVHRKNGVSATDSNSFGTLNLYQPGPVLARGEWGVVVALDSLPEDEPLWGLHTNASGDFTLTHRDNWIAARGYAEHADVASHLDSYFCFQLKALGIRQAFVVPRCPLLHQDHARFGPDRSLTSAQWSLLEDIRDGCVGPVLNGPEWGLAGEALPEVRPGRRSASIAPAPCVSLPIASQVNSPPRRIVPVWGRAAGRVEEPWESWVCGRETLDAVFIRNDNVFFPDAECDNAFFATPFFPMPSSGAARTRLRVRSRFSRSDGMGFSWLVRLQDKRLDSHAEFTVEAPDAAGRPLWLESRPTLYSCPDPLRMAFFPLPGDRVMQLPDGLELAVLYDAAQGEQQLHAQGVSDLGHAYAPALGEDSSPCPEVPLWSRFGDLLNADWEVYQYGASPRRAEQSASGTVVFPTDARDHVATPRFSIPQPEFRCLRIIVKLHFSGYGTASRSWRVRLQDGNFNALDWFMVVPPTEAGESRLANVTYVFGSNSRLRLVFEPLELGRESRLPDLVEVVATGGLPRRRQFAR